MPKLLMPKATAVWLVDNTTLSFKQIADFCALHELEIQAVADGEVAGGIMGLDPVSAGQLTHEEIKRCEDDADAKLQILTPDIPLPSAKTKGARYTPVSKRQDRPDAVAWLLKHHPELTDAQIARLVGTTKSTINAVRDRSHWNAANIRSRSPVELGLCSRAELTIAVDRGRKRVERKTKAEARAARKAAAAAAQSAAAAETPESAPAPLAAPAEAPASPTPAETPAPATQDANNDSGF